MNRVVFFLLLTASLFLSPAVALFSGIIFAFLFKAPYTGLSKKVSKYLLQLSVVGLGFGMNINESLQSSKEGMVFTIVSVVGVMSLGWLVGKFMRVDSKLSYLISSGTAICGGSAIAAISPVVKANENQITMSLAVIFTLNAIALFVFPTVGRFLELTQQQFGTWAAIAIHDTSSVVGAGAAYGKEALTVATTVKLTRALWIIPLALTSVFIFSGSEKKKVAIPWFILFFILAMTANTYLSIPDVILITISTFSHKFLSVTLFLIGTGLSLKAIKEVGVRPIVLGVTLWFVISVLSLIVILQY